MVVSAVDISNPTVGQSTCRVCIWLLALQLDQKLFNLEDSA